MPNKSLKTPAIILAVGLVLCVVACMLTGILKVPTITQQDFRYSATYQINGETKTLEGIYRCEFVSTGEGIDQAIIRRLPTSPGRIPTSSPEMEIRPWRSYLSLQKIS